MSTTKWPVERKPTLPPRPSIRSSKTTEPSTCQEVWPTAIPQVTPGLHVDNKIFNPQPVDEMTHSFLDDRLSQIIDLIDEDAYHGTAADLIIDPPTSKSSSAIVTTRSIKPDNQPVINTKSAARDQSRSINILAKISYYSNSRLPTNLPPLRVYIPTWPLLCLAAQYSSSAYSQPNGTLTTYIPSDSRLGTRATIVRAVCCDDRKTIVFAIRGTSTFSLKDWNVNLDHKPSPPTNFLDDEGNLCHSGFLRIARAMVAPIAAHLRTLLEQNPSRTACSLLITGHSAGGAVASLIYSHMLSSTPQSDLTNLTACFKRVHCVTFGAPPVSLLPLTKPPSSEARLQKCLFHSFINEGDPVVRAEPTFVRSLIDLLTTPLPTPPSSSLPSTNLNPLSAVRANLNRLDLTFFSGKKPKKNSQQPAQSQSQSHPFPHHHHHLPPSKPSWLLPPSTLSNAGRLVVLRVPPLPPHHHSNPHQQQQQQAADEIAHEFRTVTASTVTDEQIRQVVYGDLLVHNMEVYRRRIEALGFRAVTARE